MSDDQSTKLGKVELEEEEPPQLWCKSADDITIGDGTAIEHDHAGTALIGTYQRQLAYMYGEIDSLLTDRTVEDEAKVNLFLFFRKQIAIMAGDIAMVLGSVRRLN